MSNEFFNTPIPRDLIPEDAPTFTVYEEPSPVLVTIDPSPKVGAPVGLMTDEGHWQGRVTAVDGDRYTVEFED